MKSDRLQTVAGAAGLAPRAEDGASVGMTESRFSVANQIYLIIIIELNFTHTRPVIG